MSSFDRAHMTSYRRSIATIGLSPAVSEIKADIGRKSQIFPTPVYFEPHWSGSPWNWISAPGIKKLEWWGYRAEKEVWRYFQPCG